MAMRFMQGLYVFTGSLSDPNVLKLVVETLVANIWTMKVLVVIFRGTIVDLLQVKLGAQFKRVCDG